MLSAFIDMDDEMLEIGIDHFKSGRFDKAEEVFQKCIAASISPARANACLGWCLLRKGHALQASVQFKKSLELSHDNWESWLGLGRAYKNQKRGNLAIEAFENSLKLKKSVSALEDLAFCLSQTGRHQDAIKSLNNLGLQNLSPNSLIILGYSHEMVGNLDKALLAFKEAIKIAESNDAINGSV